MDQKFEKRNLSQVTSKVNFQKEAFERSERTAIIKELKEHAADIEHHLRGIERLLVFSSTKIMKDYNNMYRTIDSITLHARANKIERDHHKLQKTMLGDNGDDSRFQALSPLPQIVRNSYQGYLRQTFPGGPYPTDIRERIEQLVNEQNTFADEINNTIKKVNEDIKSIPYRTKINKVYKKNSLDNSSELIPEGLVLQQATTLEVKNSVKKAIKRNLTDNYQYTPPQDEILVRLVFLVNWRDLLHLPGL